MKQFLLLLLTVVLINTQLVAQELRLQKGTIIESVPIRDTDPLDF